MPPEKWVEELVRRGLIMDDPTVKAAITTAMADVAWDMANAIKSKAAELARHAENYEGLYCDGDRMDAGVYQDALADAIMRLPQMPKRKEGWPMTPEERADLLCEQIEAGMRRMGVITTAMHDAGHKLIADAIRAAVAEEREACARLAIEVQRADIHGVLDTPADVAETIADAIRARATPPASQESTPPPSRPSGASTG